MPPSPTELIGEIHGAVGDIKGEMGKLAGKQGAMAADLRDIKQTLHGNGRDGLCMEFDRIKRRCDKAARSRWVLWSAAITAGVVTAVQAIMAKLKGLW